MFKVLKYRPSVGSFSVKVSNRGVEAMLSVFIQVVFCTLESLYFSIVRCNSRQYQVGYSGWCRSGLCFGWLCRKWIIRLRPFPCNELSMTKSDTSLGLMVASLFPISWVELFYIAQGWIFCYFLDPFCIWNV